MARKAADESLEVLRPQLQTRPRVYYRNLYRYTHCFVGGAVSTIIDGLSECVAGASVVLVNKRGVVASLTTDAFGEFRFDKLPVHGGEYRIEIAHPVHGSASLPVMLNEESLNLGEIPLGAFR